MADRDGSLLLPLDHSGEAARTSGPNEGPARTHDQGAVLNEHERLSGSRNNPALEIRTKTTLDIEPFPENILEKIKVDYPFRPREQDGELVVPIVSSFKCVWEGLPTTVEEMDTVWCGAERWKTVWVRAKRLGTFPTPAKDSNRVDSNAEAPIDEESKSATIQRYIASLVDAGDNHITLLTAAYCVLFDRIWGYNPRSTVSKLQQCVQCKDPSDAFGLSRISPYHE